MKLSVLPIALALGVDAGCVESLGWSPALTNNAAMLGSMQAILKNGNLFAWGDNTFGQTAAFPAGAPALVSRPFQSMGVGDVAGVRAGDHHSCALLKNGTAMCWGQEVTGTIGYIGTGTTAPATNILPVKPVNLPDSYLDITCGTDTTCVVKMDGTVGCLGAAQGVMALNGVGTTDSAVLVAVTGPTMATAVAAGVGYHCSTSSTGAAWCWGKNDVGQLGSNLGTNGIFQVMGSDWASVQPGVTMTCGATMMGVAYCWGNGVGTPTAVNALAGLGWVTKIVPGKDHVCALNKNWELWCWGDNTNGELGTGDTITWANPTKPILYNIKDFQVSFDATCALTTDGNVLCSGSNLADLADASAMDTLIPKEIPENIFGCGSKSKGKKMKAAAPAKKAKKVAGAVGGAVLGVAIAGYAIRRLRKRNYVPLATATTAV
jgi:alpha-tubulin suppressor-like RCC1 family protein